MKEYTRNCIKDLEAYTVVNPTYDIILNANENPWDCPSEIKEALCQRIMETPLNRYPEATFPQLLEKLSDYTGFKAEQIICGSGSDEIIAMLNQTFIDKDDVVVGISPSFAMYAVWTQIADARFIAIDDGPSHRPNISEIIATIQKVNAKMVYLCNPNNPTGYFYSENDIVRLVEETQALIILDEAYIEFASHSSIHLVNTYNNLIVLRTFSKAFSLAGIRCGYAIGNKALIKAMYKVKSPYNLNVLTQLTAEIAMEKRSLFLDPVAILKKERDRIYAVLKTLKLDALFPSEANFIYFETSKASALYTKMKENNILIKYFPNQEKCPGAIRLGIGKPEENDKVLAILKEVLK